MKALKKIKQADRIIRKEQESKHVVDQGFYLRGRYQIITLNPRPAWITRDQWLQMIRNGERKKDIKRVSTHHNLIMLDTNVGLNLLMQHLQGNDTYPLEIDNASIGTGTTAPTQSDTDLETPGLEDIPVAISELTGVGTLYLEFFMTNDELANGEYTEFGLFCGTQLFARSLIQSPTHTKEDNEDTLIAYTITAEVIES